MTPVQPVRFQKLERIEDLERVVSLLCEVWEAESPVDLINASNLKLMVEADGYIVGMFTDQDEMIGAAVAIRGKDALHSHFVGVRPGHQGRGLGYLLKQDEAEWAKDEGFRVIRWTYDPLVRRNAYFNLAKLSSKVLSYKRNYYGELNDGLNDNDETDRLMIEWEFTDGEPMRLTAPMEADSWDFTERPAALLDLGDGVHQLVPTPADIEKLRLHEPERAQAWRSGVRAGFAKAETEGYEVTGFTPDGWYVLRRP
ncbi:putative GNAT superfamily acetyltransferase [Actinoplanes lutulentus]|uniref:Putative GNAT superfamily acetyltransferase n=1 Tax=Actinoplanes lutulentus TaxID=1287878 RepID=A0A327ZE35_9ACTN|nr:GNAT family N-acetyltransferase [Actinoplanes lutulentus]MBB2941680.1 putative GNAT superfamily acetyltransferase [Actinoplanes lutulentus]RAK39600.1 putative GNAT superfamily acetyltransferase [Actinoplanes lutulentus]